MSFGATRTTRSPRASRNRSSAPDTCRQSSIAHTRSPPRPRAQTQQRVEATAAAPRTVRSPSSRPVAASTRRDGVRALVRVRPDHDHPHRPFVGMLTSRIAGGHISVGAQATLLSGHAGDPRAAAGDTTSVGQTTRSTESQRVSPSPARGPTGRVGRHRPTPGTLALRKSRVVGGAFDGICRDFGRGIGRGSVGEGLRSACAAGRPAPGPDRAGDAGICARVVAVGMVDVGERR